MILKVKKGQDPYYVIERYIYEHTEVLEDMIAVLEIDGVRTNELLEVDSYYDGWIWLNDWWEGQPEIALIDFFPVSEACNSKNAVPIVWIQKRIDSWQQMAENETDILIRHNENLLAVELMTLIEMWKQEKQNETD